MSLGTRGRAADGDIKVQLCMCTVSTSICEKAGLPVVNSFSFFRQTFEAYHITTFSSFSDTLFRENEAKSNQPQFYI